MNTKYLVREIEHLGLMISLTERALKRDNQPYLQNQILRLDAARAELKNQLPTKKGRK